MEIQARPVTTQTPQNQQRSEALLPFVLLFCGIPSDNLFNLASLWWLKHIRFVSLQNKMSILLQIITRTS